MWPFANPEDAFRAAVREEFGAVARECGSSLLESTPTLRRFGSWLLSDRFQKSLVLLIAAEFAAPLSVLLLNPGFDHANVYGNIIAAFRSPWVVTFYVVVMLFLMLHLFHGAWSSVRTLGLSKPSPRPLHRQVATAIALVVWLGFTAIPVAVFLGVIR